MQKLVEQLIQSPKLPFYLKELQEILDKEQKKREEFYQTIDESDKVEFINGEVVFQSPVKFRHDAVSDARLHCRNLMSCLSNRIQVI